MKVLYYFNAQNRLNETIQTVLRAYSRQKSAYIFSDSVDFLNQLNRALWEQLLFLPHVFANDKNADFTPYILSNHLDDFKKNQPLIFLPFNEIKIDGLERFPFVYEIMDNDENTKNYGRARVQNYKKCGFSIQFHNLLENK